MNWNAVAAIAELLAAVGVIASLIYVAAQVRQNTGALQLAAQHTAINSLRDLYRNLLQDDRLRIFMLGVEDLGALDEQERARAMILIMDTLRTFESVYFIHMQGTLGPGVWDGWQRVLSDYALAPGIQHIWGLRKDIFSDDFRALVDSLEPRERALRILDFARGAE